MKRPARSRMAIRYRGRRKLNTPPITFQEPTDIIPIFSTMPGDWRPFLDSSPWNTPIEAGAPTHPLSTTIINFMSTRQPSYGHHFSLAAQYCSPFWVVTSRYRFPQSFMYCHRYFDPSSTARYHESVDPDLDWVSNYEIPIKRPDYSDYGAGMWHEPWKEGPNPNRDGHNCIFSMEDNKFYDVSRFQMLPSDAVPRSSTHAIWDNNSEGVGTPSGTRWAHQGSRGSGVPLIAGMLRPQEIHYALDNLTELRHALCLTFGINRNVVEGRSPQMFMNPPACRSDGENVGEHLPIEGMRFQLDPSLDESDFNSWGLNDVGKLIARCLQNYGAFLVDIGGDFKIQPQRLGYTDAEHQLAWKEHFGQDVFDQFALIPTNASYVRVLDTGEPMIYPPP